MPTRRTIATIAGTSGYAIALAFGTAAFASAAPDDCTRGSDTTVVCEAPGNAEISAVPGESTEQAGGSAGSQNGPYGPAGATPPVGN
jgi:hypothetical protein